MPPPSRTRRILKWTGAVLSLYLLAVWIYALVITVNATPGTGANAALLRLIFVAFLLLFVSLPTAWLWRRDRSSRIRPGCCLRCGYNLTGNTSGVCSECGERSVVPQSNSEGQ